MKLVVHRTFAIRCPFEHQPDAWRTMACDTEDEAWDALFIHARAVHQKVVNSYDKDAEQLT